MAQVAADANANQAGYNGNQVTHQLDFIVKAGEDLILEGKERTYIRVRAGTPYTCVMLKSQRFASLFRHYAKKHGLRKEDLAYYFVDGLRNEHLSSAVSVCVTAIAPLRALFALCQDTPESVNLQPRDEVIVRRRRLSPAAAGRATEEAAEARDRFISHLAGMRECPEHMDVTFCVGESRQELRAHKFVLVAHADYFKNMFKPAGGMLEANVGRIDVPDHDVATVRRMLEYFYTNQIADLARCTAEEFVALLSISEQYQLQHLKELTETAAKRRLSTSNVAGLLVASDLLSAPGLYAACLRFVRINMHECANDEMLNLYKGLYAACLRFVRINMHDCAKDELCKEQYATCLRFVRCNMHDCANDENFRAEMMTNPELSMKIIKYISDGGVAEPESAGAAGQSNKRRRVENQAAANGGGGAAAGGGGGGGAHP
ncbi:BTB/POZ domain-containing protein [Tribonema minus]|uniref:BTB/POZ domain-containing protein n=1 Tax=Tribonema minus TaxID=303371 RepID=A0A835Z005_9STRA|nr:BTB/POZ domain-containing protein [Tribonema minus]